MKYKKALIFFTFALLVEFSGIYAFAAKSGVVRGSYINVRKEAKFNSPVIGKKVRGDRYQILYEQHYWVKVQFEDNLTGWIYKTLIERSNKPIEKEKKSVKTKHAETKQKIEKYKLKIKTKSKVEKKKKIKQKKKVVKKAKVVNISKSAEDLYNTAILLYEKRRYSEALEKNKIALKKAPRNSEIMNNIGNCLFKLKRVNEALKTWKKALKISPKSGKICNNIGIAYYQLDQNKKAIEYYKKAILFDPQFADSYYNIASAYGFIGKFEDAISNFNKYLKLSSDTTMKKLAEERIDYCQNQINIIKKEKQN